MGSSAMLPIVADACNDEWYACEGLKITLKYCIGIRIAQICFQNQKILTGMAEAGKLTEISQKEIQFQEEVNLLR